MAKRIKSERVRYRHLIQLFYAAASNSFVTGFATGKIYNGDLKKLCTPGLNCYSCPGAVLSCPIGSLQAVIGSSAFQVSLYVLGLILLFGALLGRMVCGFLCPFGWFQELIHKIPVKFKKNKFKGDKILRKLKFIILIVFVIILPMSLNDVSGNAPPAFCKWVCPAGSLEAGIPLVSLSKLSSDEGKVPKIVPANTSVLNNSSQSLGGRLGLANVRQEQYKLGVLFWWKIGLLTLFVLLSLINYRPFCKYICPLGAMYGLMNPVSLYRLRFNKDKCINCGKCEKACKMCLNPVKDYNSVECVRCGDCVNACPTDALSMGFGQNKRLINIDAANISGQKGIKL